MERCDSYRVRRHSQRVQTGVPPAEAYRSQPKPDFALVEFHMPSVPDLAPAVPRLKQALNFASAPGTAPAASNMELAQCLPAPAAATSGELAGDSEPAAQGDIAAPAPQEAARDNTPEAGEPDIRRAHTAAEPAAATPEGDREYTLPTGDIGIPGGPPALPEGAGLDKAVAMGVERPPREPPPAATAGDLT